MQKPSLTVIVSRFKTHHFDLDYNNVYDLLSHSRQPRIGIQKWMPLSAVITNTYTTINFTRMVVTTEVGAWGALSAAGWA